MAQQIINIGTVANDRTGDTWRAALDKVNDNTTELYGGLAITTLTINAESEFPVQDATTITLESDICYDLGNEITTAKSFIVQPRAALKGPAQGINSLNYTGTGVMFTSTDAWSMRELLFSCTSGTIFAASGTGFVDINRSGCFPCTNIGTFTNAGLFGTNFTCFATGQGLVFSGASAGLQMLGPFIIGTSASFIALDLGSATFPLFRLAEGTFSGPSGSIGIKGLASSGNITVGTRAEVTLFDLSNNAMTALNTIDEQDVRWFFFEVDGTDNSRNAADAILTTLETVTISTSTIFEDVDGSNWTNTTQSRFTTDANGISTYDGTPDICIKVSGFATVAKVGGGSDELEVRIAKNWKPTDTSKTGDTNTSTTITNMSSVVDLKPGVFVSGTDIPADTTIVSVGSTTIEISNAATGSTATVSLTFHDKGIEASGGTTEAADATSVPIETLVDIVNGDDIRMITANNTGTANIEVSIAKIIITEA